MIPLTLSANSEHADEHHRGHRLQRRGNERDHHAAPDRLLIGDDIGRDDRLAMAGPDGVHDAIEEAQSRQDGCGGNGIVGLEALDAAGELSLHGLLRVDHPAEKGADEPWRV